MRSPECSISERSFRLSLGLLGSSCFSMLRKPLGGCEDDHQPYACYLHLGTMTRCTRRNMGSNGKRRDHNTSRG
eukprot:824360-Alexandrium_andersonii.AAC.1